MSVLVICPSETLGTGDLLPVKNDGNINIQAEALDTLIYTALFTDARATEDQLPLGANGLPDTSYWGGYWGRYLVAAGGVRGSLLWTLRREKNLLATWLKARDYAQQSVRPLIDSAYAASIVVDTGYLFDRAMYINVITTLPSGDVVVSNQEFEFNA